MAILEPHDDRRSFPRMGAGVRVTYRGTALRKPDRDYLWGVAENVSLGGMTIATRRPLRVGSLVRLEFHIPGEEGKRPVRAKALVCWRRRWRHPRGMGVRFVEIENLGQRRLESWIAALLGAAEWIEEPSKNQIDSPDTGRGKTAENLSAVAANHSRSAA